MKAFAFVLLCALVAVQGRSPGVPSSGSAAALGENPWLVHLRIAVSTSGLLNTCVGSIIDSRWLLTSASCVEDARFIWVRFAAVNVINPELVLETSVVRLHPEYDAASNQNNVALVTYNNRDVQFSDNISPISPVGQPGESGKVCGYGGEDGPGEQLNCYEVGISQNEDGDLEVSSDEVEASVYDIGAPLVSGDAQVGILVGAGSPGEFVATAQYADWIESETGVSFSQ